MYPMYALLSKTKGGSDYCITSTDLLLPFSPLKNNNMPRSEETKQWEIFQYNLQEFSEYGEIFRHAETVFLKF
jgi:hypothetical protein